MEAHNTLCLAQAAYTSEAWASQIGDPQNRIEQVRGVVGNLGGSIESAFYTFGKFDIIAVTQFPDNASTATFALAASAIPSGS